MRLRSTLLAGIVLPLATAFPAAAFDVPAREAGMIVLAQADCPEGQDCGPAPEVGPAPEAGGGEGENRRERRNRQRAQQEPEASAPEAQPEQQAEPAETPRQRRQRERAQRQQAEPEQQQEAQPEQQAEPAETPRQRRQRERAQQQAEPEQQAPAPEAQPEQQAEPAETPRQRRQRERAQRQQAEPEQQQEAQPEQQAAPSAEPPVPAEAAETPRQRRERLRAERRNQRNQQEGEQGNTESAPPPAAAEAPAPAPAGEPGQPPAADTAGAPPSAPAEADGGNAPQNAIERARRRQEELKARQNGQPVPPAETPAPDTAGVPPPPPSAPEGQAAGSAPPPPEAPPPGKDTAANPTSTVEQQLKAQGDDAQAAKVRDLREKLRRERDQADDSRPDEPPAAGQADDNNRRDRRRDRDPDRADREGDPWFGDDRYTGDDRDPRRGRVVEDRGDRIIIDLGGGNLRVEPTVPDEGERLLYDARDVDVENLPRGRTRTTVYREDGSSIITVRNRYGDIERRTRVLPNGREVVLLDNRYGEDYNEGGPPPILFEPDSLPPLVVDIPEDEYIVDLGRAPRARVEQTLLAPPVERIERPYTLDEVTGNERIRDKMSRIDLDTITFEFGSSTIGNAEMDALSNLGDAMADVITKNPDEVYLVEGHTDAVGSNEDNLILSDRRAEAVAVALSQNFDIPPENLVTEGYGEQYLKVDTDAAERENRRVTVRRITPLLAAQQGQ